MASITRSETKSGQRRYVVNYRDDTGRQRRKTFHKADDANTFANTVEADKARGVYVDPDAGKVTFKAYSEEWLAVQTFDVSSYAATETLLRLHVYPVLGERQLRQVKASTIKAWIRGLTVKSTTYKANILSVVSAIFTAAIDDDKISKNPCKVDSVRRNAPRRKPARVKAWESERVAAVHDAMSDRYRIAVTLAAGLGLRQGEVFGLSVDDVEFLGGVVHVRRQVRLFAQGGLAFRLPKSKEERAVPLPDSVRDELAAYLADRPARPVSLPWATTDGEPVTHNLVLTDADGSALHRNTFNRNVWAPALKVAGVEQNRENGMHACRHFYASVLLDAGESIKALSDYLGHSDPGFTLRTYTHMMPSSHDRTRRAIDSAFGRYNGDTSQERPTAPSQVRG